MFLNDDPSAMPAGDMGGAPAAPAPMGDEEHTGDETPAMPDASPSPEAGEEMPNHEEGAAV